MKKTAFTMIELVLVIVVLGILAALTIPRLERDLKQEAADNILSAIRYTQHLALLDNKHEFDNASWPSKLWNISFAADGSNYSITSNGTPAIDPSNGKTMDGSSTGSPNANVGKKYGVSSISGCNNLVIFDHLGRPFTALSTTNNYSTYMNSACTLSFTLSDGDTFQIYIEPETGYAYIVGQQNS